MSHSKLLFLLPFLLTLTLLPPFAHSRQCPVLLPNYNAANTTTVTSETTRLPSHSTERIFRGKTLNSTLLPYVAALFYRDAGETKFFCSAIVVGPRTLLTAGHCVAIFLDEFIGFTNEDIEFYAYFGAQKTSTSGAIESQIKSIFMHPEYNILDTDTYPYDIAYVTLYNDIPPSNKIMKVNANSSNPVTGSVVRSIGYGAQKVFDDLNDQLQYESKDDVVQQLDLPVVRHSYCRTAWIDLSEAQNIPEYQHNIKANYQFCAGYLKGGCGLCPGDSGGPVFQYDNTGVPVLLGIASLAYKCSSQNVPVVFVRVEPYLSTFLGDVQLTLSNSTDVYILPEERRERPDYEGDSGIDKLSTTTIIIIAVCAGLIVLTVIIVFVACVIRRNRNKTSEQGGNVTAPVSNQDDVVTAQQHVPGSIQREGVV